jgi:hypothetical protein
MDKADPTQIVSNAETHEPKREKLRNEIVLAQCMVSTRDMRFTPRKYTCPITLKPDPNRA